MKSLVLIGGTSYITEQERAIERANRAEDWNWESMRQRHVLGDDQIHKLIRQFRAFADSYDDINFTPPYLSTITARTLVMAGDHDPFYNVSVPVELYAHIPNAYLWIVPNGGHLPIHGEHHEAFVRTTLAFLRGEWDAE